MVPHWNQMDAKCRAVLVRASAIARDAGDESLSPEHLIRAVFSVGRCLGAQLVSCLETGAESLCASLKTSVRPGRRRRSKTAFPLSRDAVKTVEHARRISADLRHVSIGTEHLVLALLATRGYPSVSRLNRQGITYRRAMRLAELMFRIPKPGPAKPRMRRLRTDDLPAEVLKCRPIQVLLGVYDLLDEEALQGLPEVEAARRRSPRDTEELVRLAVDYLIWLHVPARVGRRYRVAGVDWGGDLDGDDGRQEGE